MEILPQTIKQIAILSLGILLFTLLPATTHANTDAPLIEFTFDDSFANSGTLGGKGEVTIYAKGEGPYLMPSRWGNCLDLRAASRFGGALEQKEPAGCALIFTDARLNTLRNLTVMLWYRAAVGASSINARILNKENSWEILYSNGKLFLLTAKGTTKYAYSFPYPPLGDDGKVEATSRRLSQWVFMAVALDVAAKEVHLYHGNSDTELGKPIVQKLKYVPPPSTGVLEIGNFRGIRPFKGQLDNIRIFDTALTSEQIKQIFAQDLNHSNVGTIYKSGIAPTTQHRFQPRHADIFFRALSQDRLSKLNGFDLLRAFHVTHLLWVYGENPKTIQQVHGIGVFYQGTLNGLVGFARATPERIASDDKTGRQRDLDGNKVVLPHMARWNPEHPRWVGCHNSPAFQNIFWQEADKLIKAGADSLHVDDWMMSYTTTKAGLACFCPDCIAGFRSYLKHNLSINELAAIGINNVSTFDYVKYLRQHDGITTAKEYRAKFREVTLTPYYIDFQRQTLRDFYQNFRRHLDEVSPDKYIPVSVNNQFYRRGLNGTFGGYFMVDLLDFFAGEAIRSMQTANHFVMPCKLAETFNIPQVMMWKPGPLAAGQAALATSYALGQWFRVPWDLYMDITPDGQPAPRYFGTVEDWGPLYDFVHNHPHLFNGYQTAATVGVLFNADASPYSSVWNISQGLAEREIQFRLITGAARFVRVPLKAAVLNSTRFVLQLSPTNSFCDEDRRVIEAARNSHQIRFVESEEELECALDNVTEPCIHIEGPRNIYAFLRVRPDATSPSAVIHVVNWNMLPNGSSDSFRYVSLSLRAPWQWGNALRVKYYQPGRKGGLLIKPEQHRDYLRIVLPQLETWGVIEIVPSRIPTSADG